MELDLESKKDADGYEYVEIKKASTKESAYAIYNVVTDIATHQITARGERETVGNKIAKIFLAA